MSESSSVMDMQLSKLIRRKIVVLGPPLLNGDSNGDNKGERNRADKKEETLETVTLVGVDAAGIWVESEEAANRIAERFRVKPAAPAAFFIPFAQITTIIASLEADASQTVPEIRDTAA